MLKALVAQQLKSINWTAITTRIVPLLCWKADWKTGK